MRVAVLTEGSGEFKSLPVLFEQINSGLPGRSRIVKILRVNVSPDAPEGQVAAACAAPLKIASAIADLVVILLDREDRHDCPGKLSAALEDALRDKIVGNINVRVVLKDKMFENWLISDLASLRMQPGRFRVDNALVRRVEPDRADKVDALSLLKRAVIASPQYDKIRDGHKIVERADINNIAQHSRSFRHFLHVIGYIDYRSQCRRRKIP